MQQLKACGLSFATVQPEPQKPQRELSLLASWHVVGAQAHSSRLTSLVAAPVGWDGRGEGQGVGSRSSSREQDGEGNPPSLLASADEGGRVLLWRGSSLRQVAALAVGPAAPAALTRADPPTLVALTSPRYTCHGPAAASHPLAGDSWESLGVVVCAGRGLELSCHLLLLDADLADAASASLMPAAVATNRLPPTAGQLAAVHWMEPVPSNAGGAGALGQRGPGSGGGSEGIIAALCDARGPTTSLQLLWLWHCSWGWGAGAGASAPHMHLRLLGPRRLPHSPGAGGVSASTVLRRGAAGGDVLLVGRTDGTVQALGVTAGGGGGGGPEHVAFLATYRTDGGVGGVALVSAEAEFGLLAAGTTEGSVFVWRGLHDLPAVDGSLGSPARQQGSSDGGRQVIRLPAPPASLSWVGGCTSPCLAVACGAAGVRVYAQVSRQLPA